MLNIPSTHKNTLKQLDSFEITRHPVAFETGFAIDFENCEVRLTSLEKYHRFSLKIAKEDIEYLKKEVDNGAKATQIMIIQPSYLKGKHKRREIVRNSHWKLYITLRKNVEPLTIEEFKKIQRIAIIGVDLNARHGIAWASFVWNKNKDSFEGKEMGFVKPKIKSHYPQEKILEKLQKNHGNSVKYNELWQRINKRIQRQNKDWTEKVSKKLIDIALKSIEKYNCKASIIVFENLEDYEANGNNSKAVNKANNQWLRKIAKRTQQKSLWNYSTKIITLLVSPKNTSRKCNRCGRKLEFIENTQDVYCENCNKRFNRHLNSANNIAKEGKILLSKIFNKPLTALLLYGS